MLFAAYTAFRYTTEYRAARARYDREGVRSAYLEQEHLSLADRTRMLPKVVPFVVLLIGVMVALYGGYATPSETAGLGAILILEHNG